MNRKHLIGCVGICILLASCMTTYHMPLKDLSEQYAASPADRNIVSTPRISGVLAGVRASRQNVYKNGLKKLAVLDESGAKHTLLVTDKMDIRVVKTDKTKVVFPVNNMQLNDSAIQGYGNLNAMLPPIKYSEIAKLIIIPN